MTRDPTSSFPRWLLTSGAIALAVIAVAGAWYIGVHRRNLRREVEKDLQAISHLKVREIQAWRHERLADATVLTRNAELVDRLIRLLSGDGESDPGTGMPASPAASIRRYFDALCENYEYHDVLLVDADGRVCFSKDTTRPDVLPSRAQRELATALRTGTPQFTDLHSGGITSSHHVSVIAPLPTRTGGAGSSRGAVVLISRADEFLYPLIQSWPTESKTAETLLVRREGDHVLFLNDLRYREDAALEFRLPLSQSDLPAVMAVRGAQGVVQGRDYRGEEVVAVVAPVAGAPWFMVAKVDTAEALAPLKRETALLIAVLLVTTALAGAVVAVGWQRSRKVQYLARYRAEEALRQEQERYGITLRSIGDAIIVTDAEGRVQLLNPVAEALTGWSQHDAAGEPLETVFRIINEFSRQEVESPVAQVLRDGLVVGLANHTLLISKDGTERPVSDSGAPVREKEDGAISGVVLVFRDQTEERRAQARERHLRQVLLAIRNVNQLIVQEEDPERLISGACECLTATLGYRTCWIELSDSEGKGLAMSTATGFEEGTFEPVREAAEQGNWPLCVREALACDSVVVFPPDADGCRDCAFAPESRRNAVFVRRLEYDGSVYGFLRVSVPGEVAGSEEEKTLFDEVTGDLAFALRKIEDTRALEHSRAMLARTERIAHVGSWEYDIGADRLTWSDEVYRIFGVRPDAFEANYAAFMCQVPPEDRQLVDSTYRESLENRADVYEVEHRLVRQDTGELRYVHQKCTNLKDDSGAVVRSVGMVHDITERKHAEHALAESERQYRTLFETAPVGIFTTNSDGRTLSVNPHMATMLGFDAPQQAIDYLTDLEQQLYVRPERRREFMRVLYERGEIEDFEFEARTIGGGTVWLTMNARVTDHDEDGAFTIEGFVTDITERKKAEIALRTSEMKYRLLADNALDVIWALDTNFVFTYVNPAIRNVTGQAPEEWIGTPLADHLDEKHYARILSIIERETARGKDHHGVIFETEILNASGDSVPVEIHGQILFDRNGKPAKLQGMARDITERKMAEQKQRKLREQLLQAQKMESIGRLAGGVAHDFNNLATGIMNYVDLSLDRLPSDHPVRNLVSAIGNDAQRSADLTRQLLAFARKQTVVPRVIDLNAEVSAMLDMLRRLIGEDIELGWVPADDLWPVMMDPTQVDQILLNLVVNARDAVGGAGRVTISTTNATLDGAGIEQHPDAAPGDYVCLTVSDTGHGMDDETLQQIFEPFFTTKEAGEGTGLGLSTVYGIVGQNQGVLEVDSEVGEGTVFRIYLPRGYGEADQAVRHEPAERPRGNETVLLAEDEKSIRVTTRIFLRDLGYEVLTAADPEEALSLVAEHEGGIDLLITDVVMPRMSGRDLAHRLQQDYPGMKCLFISGHTADVMARRGFLEKDVNFLAKPFTRDELAAKVRRILDGG